MEFKLIQGSLSETAKDLGSVRAEFEKLALAIENDLKNGWFDMKWNALETLIDEAGRAGVQAEELAELRNQVANFEKRRLKNKMRAEFKEILKPGAHVTEKDIENAKATVERALQLEVEYAQDFRNKFFLLDQVGRKISGNDVTSATFNLRK